jgi:hypothetical protein
VAFLGDLDEEQAAVAARMRLRSGTAVAFLLDSDAWVPSAAPGASVASQDAERRAAQLREAGWAVVPVPPGAALPALWRQAAEARAGQAPAAAGGDGADGPAPAGREDGAADAAGGVPGGGGGPADGVRGGGRAATGGPTGFSGGWS